MVLSIQGDAYTLYEGAGILSGAPDSPFLDESCGGENGTRRTGANRHSRRVVAKTADYAEPEPSYYQPEEAPHSYYSGPPRTLYKTVDGVDVWYGPFTVHSRLHGTQYKSGWFQFVLGYRGAVPITEAQAGDAYVLDPYTFKLSFIKDKSY